jgi:hypothetical protein
MNIYKHFKPTCKNKDYHLLEDIDPLVIAIYKYVPW